MHNHEFGPSGGTAQYGPRHPGDPHRHSTLSLVLLIVGVAVAATVGLSIAFWTLSLLFHLAGLILRVAILAAVAAFVWKRVMRSRHHGSNSDY